MGHRLADTQSAPQGRARVRGDHAHPLAQIVREDHQDQTYAFLGAQRVYGSHDKNPLAHYLGQLAAWGYRPSAVERLAAKINDDQASDA